MGRPRRNVPSGMPAGPKERHRRAQRSQYDRQAPVPPGFVAKPPMPKSRHHTYLEFVDNKDKKKKLEFQITTKRTPPPGFEFVPIGNPQLTTACKELSREKEAMIFIVSNSKEIDSTHLAYQVHRVGHHIRQAIVEEAKTSITNLPHHVVSMPDGEPEPIPESQQVYHAQADAAIRDLFPRIPNTDRQMIVEHAFTRGSAARAEKPVGLSEDITLARRVQLAVLAHIRHNHTRYDDLLKETSWQNARKVVEALCLDILVKWRGDEETGRDQLDEILREVVVISDSEDDSDDEDKEEEEAATDDTSVDEFGHAGAVVAAYDQGELTRGPRQAAMLAKGVSILPRPQVPPAGVYRGRDEEAHRSLDVGKKAQRGFKRYRAWEEAIRRNRDQSHLPHHSSVDLNASHGLQHAPGFLPAAHDSVPRSYPRIYPSISGSRPDDNGHAASYQRQPRFAGSWGMPQYAGQHPREKVMSAAYEPVQSASSSFSSSLQPASATGNRLEDMLVRSIEPVSPNARTPLARPLPRQGPGQGDAPWPRSSWYHHGSGPVSHHGERVYVENRTYPHRGEMPAHPWQRDALPGAAAVVDMHPVQVPHLRDREHLHSLDHHGVSHSSPMFRPGERLYESGSLHPGSPPGRRIVMNAPRPGARSHLILMEDRGGFYERIHVRPDDSMQPGPRRLTASQGLVGAEAPVLPSQTRLPNGGNDVGSDSMRPQDQHETLRGEMRRGFGDNVLNASSRPVLGADFAEAPPHGYWVIKRNHDQPAPPPNRDWVYRRPRDDAQLDERYHEHRRPRNQPDVIVLD